MENARFCYILSNGVQVVQGDKVEIRLSNDEKKYVGVVTDISETHISCDLIDETGELDAFFYEINDVQVVKPL